MERWEKQMQDLKGKEYTFDVNGEVWHCRCAIHSTSEPHRVGINICRLF